MPKRNFMQEAADAIATQTDAHRSSYSLLLIDKKILCRPSVLDPIGGTLIAELSGYDIRIGLLSDKWNTINTRLRELHEEGKI